MVSFSFKSSRTYVWLVECALPTTLSGPTAYIWLVIHLTSVHSDIWSCSVCYTPEKLYDVTFIYVIFSSMLNICYLVAMKGIFPLSFHKNFKNSLNYNTLLTTPYPIVWEINDKMVGICWLFTIYVRCDGPVLGKYLKYSFIMFGKGK